jgi:hypothetical protein
VVDVRISDDGSTGRAILDSGAALSYAPAATVAGRRVRRSARDFHPAIGGYDVEVFEVPITIGGRAITVEAAVLPPPLDRQLGTIDGWILGSDFFRDRVIVVDYPSATVIDGA